MPHLIHEAHIHEFLDSQIHEWPCQNPKPEARRRSGETRKLPAEDQPIMYVLLPSAADHATGVDREKLLGADSVSRAKN